MARLGLGAVRSSGILAAVVCATARCGPAAPEGPIATRVDSAGVQIITYDLSASEAHMWASVSEPDLEVGVMDGDPAYVFSAIGDVVVSGDGSIVVADRQTRELRAFDPEGNHLRSFGGPGGGPGEFASSPWIAGIAGDSVFAFDSRSARVTTFTVAGDLLGDVSVRSETTGRPMLGHRLPDGTFLMRSRWVNPAAANEVYETKLVLDSMVVERLDADGGFLDTVMVVPETQRVRSIQGSVDTGFRVRQASPGFVPSAHLVATGGRAVFGYSDAFDLALHTVDGDLAARVRVRGVQHPATQADLRAQIEATLIADLGKDGITPETRQLFLEYVPERTPSFRELRGTEGGEVWVSLYDPQPDSETTWLVFDPSGALLGSVVTPDGVSVRWIDDDFLLGVVRDEFDVPYLRRYPLSRTDLDG